MERAVTAMSRLKCILRRKMYAMETRQGSVGEDATEDQGFMCQ